MITSKKNSEYVFLDLKKVGINCVNAFEVCTNILKKHIFFEKIPCDFYGSTKKKYIFIFLWLNENIFLKGFYML